MKIIREHINEKFTEDSDPIEDMRIGYGKWFKLKPGDIIIANAQQKITDFDHGYPNNSISVVYKVKKNKDKLKVELIPFGASDITSIAVKTAITDMINKSTKGGWVTWDEEQTYANWRNHFNILPLKTYKKDYLNEKFSEDSDPIRDMGIGMPIIIKNSFKKIFEKDLNVIYTRKNYKDPNSIEKIFTSKDKSSGIQYIQIYSNKYLISFCSNRYYDKKGNEIDKKEYAIDLLKYADIFECMEKEIYYDKLAYYDEEYCAFDFRFIIKSQYEQYFKEGMYTPEKVLKESLFEKFTQDSDPIEDLGIGGFRMGEQISILLKKFNIKDLSELNDIKIKEYWQNLLNEWFLGKKVSGVLSRGNYNSWGGYNKRTTPKVIKVELLFDDPIHLDNLGVLDFVLITNEPNSWINDKSGDYIDPNEVWYYYCFSDISKYTHITPKERYTLYVK